MRGGPPNGVLERRIVSRAIQRKYSFAAERCFEECRHRNHEDSDPQFIRLGGLYENEPVRIILGPFGPMLCLFASPF